LPFNCNVHRYNEEMRKEAEEAAEETVAKKSEEVTEQREREREREREQREHHARKERQDSAIRARAGSNCRPTASMEAYEAHYHGAFTYFPDFLLVESSNPTLQEPIICI
jgi:hypothetical protein